MGYYNEYCVLGFVTFLHVFLNPSLFSVISQFRRVVAAVNLICMLSFRFSSHKEDRFCPGHKENTLNRN